MKLACFADNSVRTSLPTHRQRSPSDPLPPQTPDRMYGLWIDKGQQTENGEKRDDKQNTADQGG